MKCPFCGNEMKEGTLHPTKILKSDSGYRAILSIFVGFSGRLKAAL